MYIIIIDFKMKVFSDLFLTTSWSDFLKQTIYKAPKATPRWEFYKNYQIHKAVIAGLGGLKNW